MDERLVIACVMTILIVLVEHWFPWRLMLRRELPRVAAYTLGVLAIALPLTWYWSSPALIIPIWVLILSGGVATIGAYAVDWLLNRLAQADELQEILEARDAPDTTDQD